MFFVEKDKVHLEQEKLGRRVVAKLIKETIDKKLDWKPTASADLYRVERLSQANKHVSVLLCNTEPYGKKPEWMVFFRVDKLSGNAYSTRLWDGYLLTVVRSQIYGFTVEDFLND